MMTLKDIYGDLLPENEPDLEIGNIEKREDESVISSGRASTRGSVTETIDISAYDRYRNAYITGSAPTLNRAVPLPFDNVEICYNPLPQENEFIGRFGAFMIKVAGGVMTITNTSEVDNEEYYIKFDRNGSMEIGAGQLEELRSVLYEGA